MRRTASAGEKKAYRPHTLPPYSRMPVPRFMSRTTIAYIATAKVPMITNATAGVHVAGPEEPVAERVHHVEDGFTYESRSAQGGSSETE